MPGIPNIGQVEATTKVFPGQPRRVNQRSGDSPARKRLKLLLADEIGGKKFPNASGSRPIDRR